MSAAWCTICRPGCRLSPAINRKPSPTAAPLGHSLAFAAGGFLVEATTPRIVFLIAGLGVLLVLIPVMLVLRRAEATGTEGSSA